MTTSLIEELVKEINLQANTELAKLYENTDNNSDFELRHEFNVLGFDGVTSEWLANMTSRFYRLFAEQIIDYTKLYNYKTIYLYNLDLVKYDKIHMKEFDTTRTYVLVTVWIKGSYNNESLKNIPDKYKLGNVSINKP